MEGLPVSGGTQATGGGGRIMIIFIFEEILGGRYQ